MRNGSRPFARAMAICTAALLLLAGIAPATAQTTTYQPKFVGDPARSDSEAAALGYMRTVLRAQHQYKQKYGHFAPTLMALVGGARSFTRRMVNTDRGDYTATFRSKKDGFSLAMTPKQLDAQHRSFYAEDDGVIHADEEKAADESSPKVK